MPTITKTLNLNREDYFERHLSIVNCILPQKQRMTPMEIKVLSAFMTLDCGMSVYRFSSISKRVVMEKLKIKGSGLSNYMKELRAKGILRETDIGTIIWPLLTPTNGEQGYMLKLINEEQ